MEHKNLYHLQELGKPSFITYRTVKGFTLNDAAKKTALQYCVHWHKQRIFLYAAVVMPDHVHMLFTTLEDSSGKVFMNEMILKNIKGASAREINLFLGREGHVWQKGYFDTLIRNEEMLRQKVSYIINNPVEKGLVKEPDDYPFVGDIGWKVRLKVDVATGMSQLHIDNSPVTNTFLLWMINTPELLPQECGSYPSIFCTGSHHIPVVAGQHSGIAATRMWQLPFKC